MTFSRNFGERMDRSLNGQWMAYASNALGQTRVYVRPFPDVNSGQWSVSTNIGMSPLWSRDGKEQFYWTDTALMVVPVENNPTFIAGTPKVQFQRTPVFTVSSSIPGIPWDLHPDGKRFLMLKPTDVTDVESSPKASSKIKICKRKEFFFPLSLFQLPIDPCSH
jgi:hypothetical protein